MSIQLVSFLVPLQLTEELPQDGSENLIVSGITSPLNCNGTWEPGIEVNGRPSWSFPSGTFANVFWTGTVWRIRHTDPEEGAQTLFESDEDVATPALVGDWAEVLGEGTPALTADTGTNPEVLGRKAVVTHSDGTTSSWTAVGVSPAKWLPISAGITWNEDSLEWQRLSFAGGTLDMTTLPDQ